METSPPPQAPAEAGASDDGELRLGGTERGAAANGVVLALTRAARSFLLYDPSNEAIRHFLGALRDAVDAYLREWGELPLVVRPFELVVHGEVVYLDRDRERSLAFRLYRDGVRRVTLKPTLTWQELLKLLEILSIRYTGVRQAEDDMVVLLWKAGFTNIELEAVEGFVPEEELGETSGSSSSSATHAEVPPDFDLPPPAFEEPGPVRYRPLTPSELAAIQEEDSSQALPGLCVRLVRELLHVVSDPTEPMGLAEAISPLREVRDFLLAEGLLSAVLDTVRLLAAAELRDPAEARERDALLASFGDERAVARLLRSVPRDATVAPPDMVELLDRLPGNHLQTIVAVLGTERGEASRRVARSLVERFVPRHGASIVQDLATLDASIVVELLHALAAADAERALEGVQVVASRSELEVQLAALHVLDTLAVGPALTRLLLGYAAAPVEEVRVRALEQIGRRGHRAAFQPLVERVKREAPLRLGPREADAAGDALGRVDPGRALEQCREWLKPRGFFAKILPGQAMLQWVGVSSLVHVPGDEAEALIKHVSERGGADLAKHCTACMVKRRRLARGATA